MRKLLIAALIAAAPLSARAQDIKAGEAAFRKCLPCHAVGEKARNKVGPVLNGLDGRKAGTFPGYHYSSANKGSGIIWSKPEFLDYIKDPHAKIPGTKMAFAGIKNETEAENLWAYLAQFDAEGKKK
jgi:cytochrome c